MNKEKGITLVSLVVTIIILVILAGISMVTLVGDDGIITKAKQAKQNITLVTEEEALQLNQLYYELENSGTLGEDEASNKKDEVIEILQTQLNNLNETLAQTNVTSNRILAGYKAYSGGSLITGILPNLTTYGENGNAQTYLRAENPTVGVTNYDGAYHYVVNGDGIKRLCLQAPYGAFGGKAKNLGLDGYIGVSEIDLQKMLEITEAKVAKGQTIAGVEGTYTVDATATAADILVGKTAYINGEKVTGTNKGYEAGYTEGSNNAKVKRVKLGSCSNAATFSVTAYEGWQNFTNENFAMMVTGISMSGGYWNTITQYNQSASISYNASTGVVTVRSARGNREVQVQNDANTRVQSDVVCDIYLYY